MVKNKMGRVKRSVFSLLMAVVMGLTLIPVNQVAAQEHEPIWVRVFIDDNEMVFDGVPAFLFEGGEFEEFDGRVYVTTELMRRIGVQVRTSYYWHEGERVYIIVLTRSCGCVYSMAPGSTELFHVIDGTRFISQRPVSSPPLIEDGHVFFDAQTINNITGNEVLWDADNRVLHINTNMLMRLDPQPIVLDLYPFNFSELRDWIMYYLHTGGISELEHEVVRLVNNERAQAGVRPVEICPLLSAAARFKSQEMRDLDYFDHISPRFANQHQMYWFRGIPLIFGAEHMRTENISLSMQRPTTEEMAQLIMQGFRNSPPHWENILSAEHDVIGVGVLTALGADVNRELNEMWTYSDAPPVVTTQMFGVALDETWGFGDDPLMDWLRGFIDCTSVPDDAEERASEMERGLLELINNERAALGLTPLIWHEELNSILRDWGRIILTGGNIPPESIEGVFGWINGFEPISTYHLPQFFEIFINAPRAGDGLLNPRTTHVGIGFYDAGQEVILSTKFIQVE